ncbi:hypothetical protein OROHE_000904 [Orobanche hederae]
MNNFPIKCDHPRLSITVITKPTLHIFSLTSAQPKASSFQSIPPKFQFLLYSNLRFLNQHNIICKHHTPRNVSLNSSCQFVHHYGKEKWTKSRSLMHPNRNRKFFCPPNIMTQDGSYSLELKISLPRLRLRYGHLFTIDYSSY